MKKTIGIILISLLSLSFQTSAHADGGDKRLSHWVDALIGLGWTQSEIVGQYQMLIAIPKGGAVPDDMHGTVDPNTKLFNQMMLDDINKLRADAWSDKKIVSEATKISMQLKAPLQHPPKSAWELSKAVESLGKYCQGKVMRRPGDVFAVYDCWSWKVSLIGNYKTGDFTIVDDGSPDIDAADAGFIKYQRTLQSYGLHYVQGVVDGVTAEDVQSWLNIINAQKSVAKYMDALKK